MKVIGHRGASAYAPENTMAAFRAALGQGAHGIELDVHRTLDNRLAVAHDFTLERVSNGAGALGDKTMAELKALDFGARFGTGFAGEKIPELCEVLAFMTGNDMALNIEIKSNPAAYDAELVKLVAEAISGACVGANAALLDRIIISSFDHRVLVDIKKLCPGVKTGILYDCYLVDVWKYAAGIGADYIHPHYQVLDRACVESCHRHNIGVNAWTADDEADIKCLLDMGADAVITNKPDVALTLLGG
ncbi:MAG: glycerophosphodiester phosphodiesterase [Oscillospiraceae bacterium]|nr:glycerophosphodiester phosphodiesterase [Oscillospiraceae bacterium]